MALSRHHQAISKPLSVEEIVKLAQQLEFSANRPLKGWLRSAQMLLTEAAMFETDGALQMAYLYLYRHAELILGKLPEHPDFKDPKFKADITQAQRAVQKNLAKLEQWKPRINQDHQRYVQALERRKSERQRIELERAKDARENLPGDGLRRPSLEWQDEARGNAIRALNAEDNRQLAVDLAHREIKRRDATRQSTREAGISRDTVAARRRGFVLSADDDSSGQQHGDSAADNGVRNLGQRLHRQSRSVNKIFPERERDPPSAYYYPSVPAKEDSIDWDSRPKSTHSSNRVPSFPPDVPLKESLDGHTSHHLIAPPVPSKQREADASRETTATPSPPPSHQELPSKYTFESSAYTERGEPLRSVLLPPDLRTAFLNLAHPNTLRNLETCGILCGTLISNALFINHLIIPDQQSTSDTCDTTEEGDNDLFDYCDKNELLVCGWIHTHPSQSCFLSSPDLHTSSGYQVMLPEAIAIVCAPKHNPDWGVFRLTDPPGLRHILDCRQKGLFHPHSETSLYTDALRPGHVVEGPGLKFKVVDLRR